MSWTSTASTPAATASRAIRSACSKLIAEDKRVERKIALDAAGAEKGHQLGQVGGGEVGRSRPGVEATLQAEVDGIGAVLNGRPGTVPIAGGSH